MFNLKKGEKMKTYKAIAICRTNNLIVAQSGNTEYQALKKLYKNFPSTIGFSYWIEGYNKDVKINPEIQAEKLLKERANV
jgi:hypothetical protein